MDLQKSAHDNLSEKDLINKYLEQPAELPLELAQTLKDLGHKSIRLYGFLDLDSHFQLSQAWLVVSEKQLAYCEWESKEWKVHAIEITQINEVKEIVGLSCHRMNFLDISQKTLLMVRYSLRQSRIFSLIKFLVEQEIEKTELVEGDWSSNQVYQEQVLAPLVEAQSSVAGNRLSVIWRLLSYLKPYKKRVMLGGMGAAMMTLVSLVPPLLTGAIIDKVIKPYQAGVMELSQAKNLITWILLALVGTYLLREFFAWIRLRTMSVMGEYVARDLREQAYAHVQRLSLSFFSSKQTGSIISRVGSDTDRIWDFVAFGVVEVTTSVLMLLGLSVVLITLDWPLGLLVSVPVPFLLLAIARHGHNMQKLFLRAWRKWSRLTDVLSDTIPGIKVVKSFSRENHEIKRFSQRNTDVIGEFNLIHRTWTSFWPLLMLSIQAIVVSVWWWGVPRVLHHIDIFQKTGSLEEGLSPGNFVAFVLYLGMFVQPIEVIGQMARMINRATSSAHRVFELIDTKPQIQEIHGANKLQDIQGEVEFQNVSFSYDGVRKVIQKMSFKVQPGEMIGLVGSSGGGKSTTVNLILRFYDVVSGQIKIDGVNVKDLELDTYRNQVGIVMQDPYLFHGSILENIRYAKPDAGFHEIVQSAKVANAHDFIMKLPHAYDTVVGERGHTLSGGERQRVSIARAVLRNPKILILDEATSAVDTETERKIQQALDRLVKGRTVFAIAHRLSTLSHANRLFVIKDGTIVEQGSHQELLLKEQGEYKKLVDMQLELQSVRTV